MNSGGHPEIVGLDVGGANLKYSSTCGAAFSRHFAMWQHPETLADTIATDLNNRFGGVHQLAVTMTGELADCFVDRGEGVDHIVRHVSSAAEKLGVRDVFFYGVDGQFRTGVQAGLEVDCVAAANWHALATFVARDLAIHGKAVLIDVGSTTTDIIPLKDGCVATNARTDFDRMREGSLVYVGCRRTPVCALVQRLRFRGSESGVMNEWFATIDDARIVLGLQNVGRGDADTNGNIADDDGCDTADGKPRTAEMAANRLARMIGLDRRDVSIEDAKELAIQIQGAAKRRIQESVVRLAGHDCRWIISGHGDDLIELPPAGQTIRLADRLGWELARCAPSYAVAKLLQINNPQPVTE